MMMYPECCFGPSTIREAALFIPEFGKSRARAGGEAGAAAMESWPFFLAAIMTGIFAFRFALEPPSRCSFYEVKSGNITD